jgi:triacylglycerol lipase
MGLKRIGQTRTATLSGAPLGIMVGLMMSLTMAPFHIGCSGTRPQQVLCTLSKDSIPVFNFRELTESAKLARDAYRDSASNEATYGGKYLVDVFPLPKSSGQVLFLKDTVAHRQIISIRGTETKLVKSVLTDAQYTKRFDPKLGIYVHAGFGKALQELYDSLSLRLDTAYDTRITGHSLGGALAVLLTYYLTVDGYKLERTVTFGQPKVTNRDGLEKFKKVSLLRVINSRDPVAYVPPLSYVTTLNSPYQHAGGALVLQDAPPYQYVCSEASNISFVSEFWSDILGQDKEAPESLMDNIVFHRDRSYVEKLEALDRPLAPSPGRPPAP